ncbi:MAG: FecR family protein [Pseudobacter sp.]|uniref:FecR family protein n=1 Tax=Pseudobacter sp. TaxID=2045420 RepID=UPI003F7E8C64
MQNSLSYYRQLLDHYLDSAITTEEADKLFDFIKQQPEQARELLDAYRDADLGERFRHLENIEAATSRRMFDRLVGTISATPEQPGIATVHRVHFLKTGWFRYAAAAVLITGAVATVYLLNRPEEKVVATVAKNIQTDIPAGTDKATLTLGDGSRIVLDDVQNGELAQQGDARIKKLRDGQLIYDAAENSKAKVASNTLSVPRGGQYALTLSDGTKVWLNASSSIKYPSVFAGAQRLVEISGEAYLEIAKNTRQPFVVKTDETEIQVLGTSFNVNAYEDEHAEKTTLIEGSARVIKSSSAQAKLLIPGQQAEVAENVDDVKVQAVDTEQTIAWKNGFFSFNNADIKTVMRQLSRWYDINIVYENGVPQQRFVGEMNRSLTLSQVLKGLEVTKVNFRLEGRNLIVMP